MQASSTLADQRVEPAAEVKLEHCAEVPQPQAPIAGPPVAYQEGQTAAKSEDGVKPDPAKQPLHQQTTVPLKVEEASAAAAETDSKHYDTEQVDPQLHIQSQAAGQVTAAGLSSSQPPHKLSALPPGLADQQQLPVAGSPRAALASQQAMQVPQQQQQHVPAQQATLVPQQEASAQQATPVLHQPPQQPQAQVHGGSPVVRGATSQENLLAKLLRQSGGMPNLQTSHTTPAPLRQSSPSSAPPNAALPVQRAVVGGSTRISRASTAAVPSRLSATAATTGGDPQPEAAANGQAVPAASTGAAATQNDGGPVSASAAAIAEFEQRLGALQRTKESVLRAAGAAIAAANGGDDSDARKVARTVVQALGSRANKDRRIDFFYLIDAMLQVSQRGLLLSYDICKRVSDVI